MFMAHLLSVRNPETRMPYLETVPQAKRLRCAAPSLPAERERGAKAISLPRASCAATDLKCPLRTMSIAQSGPQTRCPIPSLLPSPQSTKIARRDGDGRGGEEGNRGRGRVDMVTNATTQP